LTEEKIAQIEDWENSNAFSMRERVALRFAEKLALDHKSLDDAFYARLAAHFSDAEILELGMMIGQYIGFGRLLRSLDLDCLEYSVEGRDHTE
jgi:alkylhydroperoxidase family enzyme